MRPRRTSDRWNAAHPRESRSLAVRIYSLAKELKLDSKDAGRYLHQGGRHRQGVCAGQPDRRRSRQASRHYLGGASKAAAAGGQRVGRPPPRTPALARPHARQLVPPRGLHRAGGRDRSTAGKCPCSSTRSRAKPKQEAARATANGAKRIALGPAIKLAPLPTVASSLRRRQRPKSRRRRSPTSSCRSTRSGPARRAAKPLLGASAQARERAQADGR